MSRGQKKGHGKPTNGNGRIVLGTPQDPITTYGLGALGYVEMVLRSPTLAEADADFLDLKLRVEIPDPEGGPGTVVVDASDTQIVGPFYPTITEGVYDTDGSVITPPELDTRPHYDVRLHDAALEVLSDDLVTPQWEAVLLAFIQSGMPIQASEKNRSENGNKLGRGTTQIDPATITRGHVFQ